MTSSPDPAGTAVIDAIHALDDPRPFVPGPALRDGAKARGRTLRNRRRRRAGLLVTAPLAVILLLVLGFTAYERNKAQQITRLDLGASLTPLSTAPTAPDPDAGFGPFTTPVNILVVGTDASIPGVGRPTDLQNTDTMMVVRLDPTTGKVHVLSLPRDLYVDIPGHGPNRLNAAWELGGPQLLIDTLREHYGIPINHYLGVDGLGFARLVDQAGGVGLHASVALRDANTGFVVDTPGCVHLDGMQSLALVRSRHLVAVRPGGRNEEDPRGDLGRVARQQLVASTLAASLLATSPTPAAADQLLDTLVATATLDTTWSLKDMAAALHWATGVDLDQNLVTAVPPAHGTVTAQGAAVLLLDEPAADAVLAPFRPAPEPAPTGSTAPTTAAPTTAASTGAGPTVTVPVAAPADAWLTATGPDGARCP